MPTSIWLQYTKAGKELGIQNMRLQKKKLKKKKPEKCVDIIP